MAQRGFSAVWRALVSRTHPQQQRVAPPDSLSMTSNSSIDEELIVDPPPPPTQPLQPQQAPSSHYSLRPRRRGRKPVPVSDPPNAYTSHSNDNPNPNQQQQQPAQQQQHQPTPKHPEQETPSSHYSLRPRHPRNPNSAQAPDPPNAETSHLPAQPPSSNPTPNISLRPSQAAQQQQTIPDNPKPLNAAPRPQLPAPSAATTSGIAGRPDLLAVGDLDAANLPVLRNLCKRLGVSPTGKKDQLKLRLSRVLAERRFLNEDTVMLDPDGKPLLPTAPPLATFGPLRPASTDPADPASAQKNPPPTGHVDRPRGFDLTTTTVNKPNTRSTPIVGPTPAPGSAMPTKPDPKHRVDTVAKSTMPTLNITPGNGLPTLSTTGVGVPCDLPPSPAPFAPPPGNSGNVATWLRTANDPCPAGSVDARGGNQVVTGTDGIFQELAAGRRNLSVNEYEACLKVLLDNVSPTERNVHSEAIAMRRTSGALPLPRDFVPTLQVNAKPGNSQTGAMTSARGSSAAGVATAGASSAMRPPQIPPAPPNTPGLANAPFAAGYARRGAPVSSTVREAADVLRGAGGASGKANGSLAKSVADPFAPVAYPNIAPDLGPGAAAGNVKAVPQQRKGPGRENDISSERNMQMAERKPLEQPDSARIARSPPLQAAPVADIASPAKVAAGRKNVQKPDSPSAPEKKSPYHGVFAGALGGPGEHNTLPEKGMVDDRIPKESYPDQVEEMEIGGEAEKSTDRGGTTPANAVRESVAEGREERFVTPREIIRSFNRDDGMLDDMTIAGVPEQRAHSRDRPAGTPLSRRNTRPFSTNTPVSLPKHLRGFSAMGTLGGTPGRPRNSADWSLTPGRVVGPSSFRPRRPMSTTSAMLVDLRNSNAAYSNAFIAEKMRRRGSTGGPTPQRAPLPASTLRILDELKKVRLENRSLSAKKRIMSPVPIPPSVAKRARRHGSFSMTGSAGADGARTVGEFDRTNGIDVDPQSNVAERPKTRPSGSKSPLRLKPVSNGGKKRKPIAFGIGKKRAKSASLSKAAVSDIKSFLDGDGNESMTPDRRRRIVPVPQFTFGDQFRKSPIPASTERTGLDRPIDQMNEERPRDSPSSLKRRKRPAPGPSEEETQPSPAKRERPSAEAFQAPKALQQSMSQPFSLATTPVLGSASGAESEKPQNMDASTAAHALSQEGKLSPFTFGKDTGKRGTSFGNTEMGSQQPSSNFESARVQPSLDKRDRVDNETGGVAHGLGSDNVDTDEPRTKPARTPAKQSPFFAEQETIRESKPYDAQIASTSEKKNEEARGTDIRPDDSLVADKGKQVLPGGTIGSTPFSFGTATAKPLPFNIRGAQMEAEVPETTKVDKPSLFASGTKPSTFDVQATTKGGATAGFSFPVSKQESDDHTSKRVESGGAENPTAPKPFDATGNVNAGIGKAIFSSAPLNTFPSSGFGIPATSGAFGTQRKPAVDVLSKTDATSAPTVFGADAALAPATLEKPTKKQATDIVAAQTLSNLPGATPAPFGSAGSAFVNQAPLDTPIPQSKSLLQPTKTAEEAPSVNPTGSIFGTRPTSTSAAALPFTFGSSEVKAKNDKPSDGVVYGTEKTEAIGGAKKPDTVSNSSAVPVTAGNTGSAETASFSGSAEPGTVTKPSGPLFGQPASSPAVTNFGAAFENAASGPKTQAAFSFGASALGSTTAKDPSGPFGGPQFGSKLPAAPAAGTFVFGKSAAPPPRTAPATTGNTGSAESSGITPLPAPFGGGFQEPALSFGTSQAAFPAPSQLGSSATNAAGVATPFGSGANPFGAPQTAGAGGNSVFGSSQPASTTTPSQPKPFGFGGVQGGTAPLPVFGAFGAPANGQQSGFAPRAPFGSGTAKGGGPAPQPAFGSGFGAGSAFGSGTGNGSDSGSFSMGASNPPAPSRRPRKMLKGRRIMRH